MVAQVDVRLVRLELLLAHLGEGEHDLEPFALPVLERGEAELAGVALEDHPPGDAHHVVGLLPRLEARVRGADLRERVADRHAHRVRLAAGRQDAVALGPADLHLLGQVVDDRFGGGHRAESIGGPPAAQPTRSSARSRIGEECVSPPTDR